MDNTKTNLDSIGYIHQGFGKKFQKSMPISFTSQNQRKHGSFENEKKMAIPYDYGTSHIFSLPKSKSQDDSHKSRNIGKGNKNLKKNVSFRNDDKIPQTCNNRFQKIYDALTNDNLNNRSLNGNKPNFDKLAINDYGCYQDDQVADTSTEHLNYLKSNNVYFGKSRITAQNYRATHHKCSCFMPKKLPNNENCPSYNHLMNFDNNGGLDQNHMFTCCSDVHISNEDDMDNDGICKLHQISNLFIRRLTPKLCNQFNDGFCNNFCKCNSSHHLLFCKNSLYYFSYCICCLSLCKICYNKCNLILNYANKKNSLSSCCSPHCIHLMNNSTHFLHKELKEMLLEHSKHTLDFCRIECKINNHDPFKKNCITIDMFDCAHNSDIFNADCITELPEHLIHNRNVTNSQFTGYNYTDCNNSQCSSNSNKAHYINAQCNGTHSNIVTNNQHVEQCNSHCGKFNFECCSSNKCDNSYSDCKCLNRNTASSKICRYHRKFGSAARNCLLPCSFKSLKVMKC